MFQTGYYALGNYATPYYMRGVAEEVPFTPEPTFPPGTRRYDEMARWIEAEDELLMLVIRAFLTMKDRE